MPSIKLIEVVDVMHKNDRFPPENLLASNFMSRWLSSDTDMSYSIQATFRLAKPTVIQRIDFGNAGSASVSALVSRSGCSEFRELIPSIEMRSASDCRVGNQGENVKLCTLNDLSMDTRHHQWDLLRIVCCQPYRRSLGDRFGLSFITVYGDSGSGGKVTQGVSGLQKFKDSALKNASKSEMNIKRGPYLSRAEKILLASKAVSLPNSPDERKTKQNSEDDFFTASVISFLEAHSNQGLTAAELRQRMELQQALKFTSYENRRFMEIFQQHSTSNSNSVKSLSGVLTPRAINRQLTSPLSKQLKDTKISILKPHLIDPFNSFGRENVQTVFRAEVVHNHVLKEGPVKFGNTSGKENSPFFMRRSILEEKNIENGRPATSPCKKSVGVERKLCPEKQKNEKVSPRDHWKIHNDIEKCESDQISPDSWLKRKSDPFERSQPLSKKRPRDTAPVQSSTAEPISNNRVTPAGGWLLNNMSPKATSPAQSKTEDSVPFPFRVSPPPPPDRPSSPLPLVDDIDQPSTSSKETVAERNIRLELERRLTERSPPERVVQRTSSGKVRGTYCTKGMNVIDSPERKLPTCEEGEEVDSPQARRKLTFARQNGCEPESELMVECPVCRGFVEDINKHIDECAPSPLKRPDEEDDNMMACPICCLLVSRDTVAAHADECAQKRYGA